MGIPEADLIRALNRGQLLSGMHRRDVDRIMGTPTEVVAHQGPAGSCNDLWYRDRTRGWHTVITMCGGRLHSHSAATRR